MTTQERADKVKGQIKLIEAAIKKLQKVGDVYCNIDKAIKLLNQELMDAKNELQVRENELSRAKALGVQI